MRAPPGRELRLRRVPPPLRLLVAAPFFFLTGFYMFCTPTDAHPFPIQVSPQWIKSADRTVVEVTNLVMQADTSGDGLLDTQEITVGASQYLGFVTWPRRRCAEAVPRVLGQPCPSNSATVLLLGSLHVEAVLFFARVVPATPSPLLRMGGGTWSERFANMLSIQCRSPACCRLPCVRRFCRSPSCPSC